MNKKGTLAEAFADRRQFTATVTYYTSWDKLPTNAHVQPYTVADFLGCSMKTITRHVQAGKLKGFTVGEVNRWIASQGGSFKRGRPPKKMSGRCGQLLLEPKNLDLTEKEIRRAGNMRNFRV